MHASPFGTDPNCHLEQIHRVANGKKLDSKVNKLIDVKKCN